MFAWLDDIKVIISIILASVILGFAIYIKVLKHERDSAISKNQTLSSQLIVQNQAINDLKTKAQQQAKILLQAEKSAQLQAKIDQDEIKKIMSSRVPHDCNGAIKWGAIQSARIAQEWV